MCHAECLGAWTSFWAPCRDPASFLGAMFTATFKATARLGFEVKSGDFNIELESKSDMCGLRWHMDRGQCMEAVTERLVWLLYPKFVHYSFTVTSFRMLNAQLMAKHMTLRAANVLLRYTWLVVALFGPCLPVLTAQTVLLVNIYSVLLFAGGPKRLLDINESDTADVQIFGFSSVALLALALQSSHLRLLRCHADIAGIRGCVKELQNGTFHQLQSYGFREDANG
eukprot:3177421-Amphidinium_carterae.1